MWAWPILVPVIGICLAAALPLARHAQKQRDEGAAVRALRNIQQVQGRFKAAVGSYATDAATLAAGCPGVDAALPADLFANLAGAGYVLQLRPAADGTTVGRDCHGRPTATDYYLAAAPRTSREAADKAFAGRADGQLFFFVDGVAPREADMAGGLAIPIDALESFKIP
jgi:type II secretory pathway pseudopilin PulG